jgi:hypothetical protein
VTESTRRFRSVGVKTIYKLTALALTTVLLLQIPFLVLGVNDAEYRVAAPFWMLIGTIIQTIIIVFLIGVTALSCYTLKRTKLSSQSSLIEKTFKRAIRASCHIFCSMILVLILASFNFLKNDRAYYTDPRCFMDPAEVLTRIFWSVLLYACGLVLHVSHTHVFSKPRANTTTNTTC